MKYFSVHFREEAADSLSGLASDTVFVREGFNLWAFVFPFVWFIFKRMWLVLAFYTAIELILLSVASLALVPPVIFTIVGLGFNLLIGFEAHNLQRWTLERRRFKERAVVGGHNLQDAERNFYLSICGNSQNSILHSSHVTAL